MSNHHSPGRRRALGYGAAGIAAALTGPLSRHAFAQSAKPLTVGLLRAPASAIVDLSEQRGWFKEAGVQINEVLFASAAGPKIVQALGGGSVGLSFVNSTAALLGMAGGQMPLRFISIATDPSKLFAVLAQPGIDGIPNLAGKRVACTAGTGLQYFLARILAKFNMTMKDIEFVNLPAADGQAAFVAGRVDAVVPSVNGRFSIMNTKKDAREIFRHDDFTKPPGNTQPFLNYDLFVTTESVLKSDRAALQAFLSRLSRQGRALPDEPGDASRGAAHDHRIREQGAEESDRHADDDAHHGRQRLLRSQDDEAVDDASRIPREASTTRSSSSWTRGQMKSAPDLDKAIVTDLL